MSCFVKGLVGIGSAGIGAFFGAMPATYFVDVPKSAGAIIGASLAGTVSIVLMNVAEKIQDMAPLKKTCLGVVAVGGSYFTGVLVGVNASLKAGYDVTFSEGIEVSGWVVTSAAACVAAQLVAVSVFCGAYKILKFCKRSNEVAISLHEAFIYPPNDPELNQENPLPEGSAV